ncbi:MULTISPECIES: MarR family winged helix-turn-helix transcriptional regulator [Gordonia]|uniref:HTH marR-type domain-containing protein n=2 Tax=Gordonia TaxID=2053 RepID=A0ABN3H8X4_9ACTN|nr:MULTISPECIES: MarR family transcriptional regulator [Gordonia]AUH69340.1 MarR family transcriptional regulator [Gordonia sp. YC-JH1]KJR09802.1 MarR family transcriptional regulator [Gordonia sihwensis]KXT56639.1 MarR family transcriptional regulator [Gordonia sp. QH-12]MBY4571723.1 MarR family transcriptional regulator [Gordonia sihwensis]WFN94347.1 MarR family transcriptional regulator [Gordonia sihwensis]
MTETEPGVDRVTEDDGAWELTAVITQLRRSLRSSVREDFAWESLPMAQVEFLQRLAREPGLRIGELARKHRMATNTVSTLVNQMVKNGLIVREPVPDDRRAVQVRLTEVGRTRLDEWTRANERRISEALAGLDGDQRAAIRVAVPALAALAARLDDLG